MKGSNNRPVTTRSIVIAASLLALGNVFADEVLEEESTFDIPDQPLGQALLEFSKQADVQIIMAAETARGLDAEAIHGTQSNRDALEQLLADRGLEYSEHSNRTIAVHRTTAAAAEGGDSDSGNRAAAGATPMVMAQSQMRVQQSQASQPNERKTEREKRPIEEIVVTGTNIRGIAPESSPMQIYDRADIERSGVTTIEEFTERLPQNFGGGSSADIRSLPNDPAAGSNNTRGSGVNLRGLGSGSTLVLLNGRRLAPSGSVGDFVDISLIPLSAIEQVDVILDGASAIYGADAIGGVINFRLRDDYEGVETFAGIGGVTEGDLMEYRAGTTLGENWSGGNVLTSYEFFDRGNLGAEERGFASAAPLPNDLLPEQQRHSILAAGSQEIGDVVRLFGHAFYSRRDSNFALTNTTNLATFLMDTQSEQYGVTTGGEINIGGDWLLTIAGDYNKVEQSRDSTFVGVGITPAITDSELWSADAVINGAVFSLPGGDVKLAIGTSYREETYLFESSFNRSDDRNARAVFGEVFVPIFGPSNRARGIESLELSLAGRYDEYSDFGGSFNPKVGVLWSPLDGLRLRSTYGTSFNPPNLGDTGSGVGRAVAFNLPDPASPTGTSVAIADATTNVDLGPEEATTWTVGLDFQDELGANTFQLNATYYNVRYENRIGKPTLNLFEILPNPDTFAAIITRNADPNLISQIIALAESQFGFQNLSGGTWNSPGDEDVLIDFRLRNLARTDTSGVDLNLSYDLDRTFGDLRFTFDTNYIFEQKSQIAPQSPLVDHIDTIFYPADLRIRGGASWNNNGFGASLFVNHVDGYDDTQTTPAIPVDSWTTVDLSLRYDTGTTTGDSLIGNTTFSLSVLNLFDQDPPFVATNVSASNFGFDPTNASPLGRFIAFRINKKW